VMLDPLSPITPPSETRVARNTVTYLEAYRIFVTDLKRHKLRMGSY